MLATFSVNFKVMLIQVPPMAYACELCLQLAPTRRTTWKAISVFHYRPFCRLLSAYSTNGSVHADNNVKITIRCTYSTIFLSGNWGIWDLNCSHGDPKNVNLSRNPSGAVRSIWISNEMSCNACKRLSNIMEREGVNTVMNISCVGLQLNGCKRICCQVEGVCGCHRRRI